MRDPAFAGQKARHSTNQMHSEDVSPSANPVAISPGIGQKTPNKSAESPIRLSRKTIKAIERHINDLVQSATQQIKVSYQSEPQKNHPEEIPRLRLFFRVIMELLLEHKITVAILGLVTLIAQFFGKISYESVLTMVFGGATGFVLAYALNKNRA